MIISRWHDRGGPDQQTERWPEGPDQGPLLPGSEAQDESQPGPTAVKTIR